jgi:DNA-binding transcriptional MerR regulator
MVDTDKLTKLYYTIGEVAEMFDVSASLIRYWESEFNYLKPQKNNKGDRRFTKQNVEQLNVIYHLVKEKGYTLDGAKRELKENRKREQRKQQLLKKLVRIRKQLDNLQKGI